MLEGEREWLAAVVAKPADETVKLAYADWLQEHGDADRAAFLREFVAATRTMDAADFPKSRKEDSTEWLDLIGFWFLQGLAAEGRPELKVPALKLARPALRMVTEPEEDAKIPVGASKLGGRPDLPPGFAWPKGEECRATYNDDTEGVTQLAGFLAQVNFAEFAHALAAKELPKRGLLSFFCFQDMAKDNPDVIGAKAVFFPNAAALVRTKPPGELNEGNTEMPSERLTFVETLDLPQRDGPWQDELIPDLEAKRPKLYDYVRDGNFYNLFGYGRPTTGDDPTPDRDHVNLIVLHNAAGCRLHIQIHRDDLAALNFNAIKLVWVDFD